MKTKTLWILAGLSLAATILILSAAPARRMLLKDPVVNYSTYAAGSPQGFTAPSLIGQWWGSFTWPIVAVHMTLLPNGKVLAWDSYTVIDGAQIWDPSSGTFIAVPNNNTNLFCSSHTLLADGRVLVDGGHIDFDVGALDTNIFDPSTQTWSLAASMSFGRWYPTAITLADGRVLAASGHTTCESCVADTPEVYDPIANTWTLLSNAPLSVPTQYPHLYVLPDGRVLLAGSSEEVVAARVLDVSGQTWAVVDPVAVDGGSSVMYEPGKVMKTGGAWDDGIGTPSADTYVLDMNQPAPAWRQTAPMALARVTHNLALLPDGTVLVIGGSNTADLTFADAAVYEAELWSPVTETWTTMAQMSVPRMYHSTALLLPDGRVLVAGSGRAVQQDQFNGEIYSPPYLFKGARPTITSAPSTIQYASAFSVATPDASRIATVSLVRLGSVTHAFNTSQRLSKLSFQPGSSVLNVRAPANSNLAPPGFYMLFILDTNGVPSVASFVRLVR